MRISHEYAPHYFVLEPTAGMLFDVVDATDIPEEVLKPSDEVLALAQEQAGFEYERYSNGRDPKRTDKLSATKFGSRWVMLAARGHDIALGMPKFAPPQETPVSSAITIYTPPRSQAVDNSYSDIRSAAANDKQERY